MVAGDHFALVGLIHPPQIVASVTTGTWTIIHSLTIVMSFFGLLGVAQPWQCSGRCSGWCTSSAACWFDFRPPPGRGAGEAELGYRLRQEGWGQGYATEGAVALIRTGFSEGGVERVVASTLVAHTASRRVMEKAGLKLVRTFGQEQGCVEYALTRAEWQRGQAERARRAVMRSRR
jgi:Acetyltransferase (GNAT) domain